LRASRSSLPWLYHAPDCSCADSTSGRAGPTIKFGFKVRRPSSVAWNSAQFRTNESNSAQKRRRNEFEFNVLNTSLVARLFSMLIHMSERSSSGTGGCNAAIIGSGDGAPVELWDGRSADDAPYAGHPGDGAGFSAGNPGRECFGRGA